MASLSSLHPSTLLRLKPPEANAHFQRLLGNDPSPAHVESINDQLLGHIYSQALPPTVYKVWLPLALHYLPSLIIRALCDQTSSGVRDAAIDRTRHLFRSAAWKSNGWDILGGVDGIASIIDQLPIADVRRLAKAIARCRFADPGSRTACIEALAQRVLEAGSRPLFRALSPLYPLRDPDWLVRLIPNLPDAPSTPRLLLRLAPMHPDILRRVVVGSISAPQHVRVSVLCDSGKALIDSPEPYCSSTYPPEVQNALLPGMVFFLDFCSAVAADDLFRSDVRKQVSLYAPAAFRLAARRFLPFAGIELFFAQLIQLPSRIWYADSLETPLARELMHCWAISFYGRWQKKDSAMKRIARGNHPSHPGPQHRDSLHRDLCSFLRRHQDGRLVNSKYSSTFVRTLTNSLPEIPPVARGPFLGHLCRLSDSLCYEPGYEQFSFDVAVNPPREREKQIVPLWSEEIVQLLPAESGRLLFDRMLAIHGCAGFLPTNPGYHLDYENQCQLKAKWEAEGTGELDVGRQLFHDLQKRAERQRDATQRAEGAAAAVRVAKATSSVDLWGTAVRWSKRFLRDTTVFPDVIQSILDAQVPSCTEMPSSRQPSSLAELRSAVDSVNESLGTLRNILILFQREPSMRSYFGSDLLKFWEQLVVSRVLGIKRFRRAGLGTEWELIDILLMPLIPELVAWERVSLEENAWIYDHEKQPQPLKDWEFEAPGPPAGVLRFLDELACQLDALFQDHRRNRTPALREVGEGFPRGLAVQHLLPARAWVGFALRRKEDAPFITSRVLDVLEATPEVVLAPAPSDDRIVSGYIDDMSWAVRGHLSLLPSRKLKNKALVRLWEKYAARRDEYGEYLPVLQTLMLSGVAEPLRLYAAARVIRPPRLPEVPERTSEIIEWDPASSAPAHTPPGDDRPLPKNLLYLRLLDGRIDRHAYITPANRSPDVLNDAFWASPSAEYSASNRDLLRRIPAGARDGVIMSALLYLDSVVAEYTPKRILVTAFPSSDCHRTPAMRLADKFVKNAWEEDKEASMSHCVWVLRCLVKNVPALLLRDVTVAYLDSLQALEKTNPLFGLLLQTSFGLIRCLVLSDSPELAVDIVSRVIERYPSESSYHRHMKLPKLGRRLQPDAAAALIQRFARFVCGRLVEQQRGVQKPSGSEQEQAYVKITTVKLLAQILGEADFLATDTTLDIFRELTDSSHHVDIRAAVVAATLRLFDHVPDSAVDKVIQFLASLADTVAGPSESEPTPDPDTWTTILPNVSSYEDRPALSSLIGREALDALPPKRRAQYAKDVLIPLVNKSTAQHTHWMDIFLSRLNLSRGDDEIQIPDFGPFSPDIRDDIVRDWAGYLPAGFLREHHRAWALASTRHHSAHEYITQTLKAKDPAYKQTNAGEHWDEIVTLAREADPLWLLDKFLSGFLRAPGPHVENGITLSVMVEEHRTRLREMARSPMRYDRKLGRLVVSTKPVVDGLWALRGYRKGSEAVRGAEQVWEYTLFDEALRGIVDDIRGLARKTDPPRLLPSGLELAILLLPSPDYNPNPVDKLQDFVSRLSDLLRHQIEDPSLVLEFGVVEKAVKEVRGEDAIAVAEMLAGQLDSVTGQMESCLRARLAKMLLEKVRLAELNLSAEVREMVGRWRESRIQIVRRMGWEVLI